MVDKPHFLAFDDLGSAEAHLGYPPLALQIPATPKAIRVHVRDHRLRDVLPSLEVYYEGFVMSHALRDRTEAERMALGKTYGISRSEAKVREHRAARYELGPEAVPGDPDTRVPAVVVWADGGHFLMLASDTMMAGQLLEIARSLYEDPLIGQ